MGLEKINTYKKELGLTNDDLARLSGIPKSTVDKLTAGETTNPKLGTIQALARVLGKKLVDFDDDDINKIPTAHDNAQLGLTESQIKRNILKDMVDEVPNEKLDSATVIFRSVIDAVK